MNNIELKTSDPIYNLEVNRANTIIKSDGFEKPIWGSITGDITLQKDLMNLFKPMTDEECPLTLKLVINAGNTETSRQNIRVFLRTRELPTHYKLSENPDFNNVEWVSYNCNFVDFKISQTKGEHTVYGLVKNQYKESEIAFEKITLI